MPHDGTPNLHRLLLKRCALGDKEAFGQLTQMYYDHLPEERGAFLDDVIRESDKTRAKLKKMELLALEDREATLADNEEDAEREEEHGPEGLRTEGSGGDDHPP